MTTTWEMPDSISPSRMSTFLQCPFKFRVETIQKLDSGTNAAAVAGTTMHAALELLMERPPEERTRENLAAHVEDCLVAVKTTDDYLSLTDDQLKDFDAKCRRVAPRAFDMLDLVGMNVESTEMRLEVDIDGWVLRGIIDLLERRDDGLVVLDHKTGRTPSEHFQAKSMLGIDLYALMITEQTGEVPVEVALLYLDSRTRISKTPTARAVAATRRKVLAVRDAIQRACDTDGFRPSTSKLCDYCAVKPHCPAHHEHPEPVPVAIRRPDQLAS